MIEPLKRAVAFFVGVAALLRTAFRQRKRRALPEAMKLLRDLAQERSSSVPDLCSRTGLDASAALTVLRDLEEHGLVRLSAEKGAEHVRIAAITEAGRKEIARLP